MTIPTFDISCVSQTNYGYTKRDSVRRLPALKGRPRYRLLDVSASYILDLTFTFTPEQYAEFQTFWYHEIDAGLGYFFIRLMLDDVAYYNQGTETYQAHATGPFDSRYSTTNLWTVRMSIEVAGGFRTDPGFCDDIYGGPVDNLAPDDIYGGPISNLATDDIAPCPYVDPHG